MDTYRVLRKILDEFEAGSIAVDAGAYGIHVEPDPTKDVDIALSKPLSLGELGVVLSQLSDSLKALGYRVLGGGLQHGRSSEDWIIQIFIGLKPVLHVVGLHGADSLLS